MGTRPGTARVKGMTDAASNAQHKYCAILFLVAISSNIFCISTNSFLFPRSVDGTNDKSCLGGDVYRFSLHYGSLIGGGWRTFLVCSRAFKEPLFYSAPKRPPLGPPPCRHYAKQAFKHCTVSRHEIATMTQSLVCKNSKSLSK